MARLGSRSRPPSSRRRKTPPRRDPVTIEFVADIEPAPARRLLRETQDAVHEGADAIRLLLSSPGGDLQWGFTLYNHLRFLPVRLTTVNVGFVGSMAIPVYCAGQERLSAPHAKFLFHPPAAYPPGIRGHPATDHLGGQRSSLGLDAASMADIIAAACHQAPRRIRDDMDRHHTLDARGAMAYGLVHRVIRRREAPLRALVL